MTRDVVQTSGSLEWLRTQLRQLEDEAIPRIAGASDAEELERLRVQYLGRRSGWMSSLSAGLAALQAADRPEGGRAFNDVKQRLERLLADKLAEVARARQAGVTIDPTMPARHTWQGSRHPVSIVLDEITAIFRELGFTVALGPEAEDEWYNFGALNFPADHPAMDLHDTLYLEGSGLLRTHTSPVQVRTLQAYPPPVRILAPGTVYRRDFFDATHAPAFTQLEGLAVDEGISFADLKATLTLFAKRFYGPATRTRFGPSYFPFTEPSAQMEVEVDLGDGRGPRWLEIMGCGLVHPAVLEAAGLDSERWSGWAFGMGPGRIAMSRYDIPDIRLLYDSDVRFLAQFA
ncbi:MAG TPA: phenylalanine--tRNA ligase subunit alpha [Gemmatimonadaceae bacterium]